MAIVRLDPFQLQRHFFQPFFDDQDQWPELTMTQGLNLYEENDGKNNYVIVEASVPGIPEDKLEITYEDGVLHIFGRSDEKEEKKKSRVVHRMQRVSSFDYTTYLPRPIDKNKIEASIKNGVLTVKAPIAEEAMPKRIQVKTTSQLK